MNKRLLKKIAKTYAANVVFGAMETGAYSDQLTQDENDFLSKEMQRIGISLSPDVHMGDLDLIVIKIKTPTNEH